jgi:hypothetical protein
MELSDITLTFIESKYPRKLLKYLINTRNYRVEDTSRGVYQILGDYLPIQIIDSGKLSDSENLWLKSLTNNLKVRNATAIIEEGSARAGKVPLGAYLYVLSRANSETFMEVGNMAVKTKKRKRTFEEVFTEAGFIPEWMARGEAIGEARGITKGEAIGMTKGEAIGEARGKAEGEAIGEERKALDIARNMINLGFSFEAVISATELNPKKVKSLYKS